MSRSALLGLVAFIAVFAGSAWSAQHYLFSAANNNARQTLVPLISSSKANLKELQEVATNSCRCLQNGGRSSDCKRDYVAARSDLMQAIYGVSGQESYSEAALACDPVSRREDCFDFTDGTSCVTTGYDVVRADRSIPIRTLCTAEEARAVEQAYSDGGQEAGDNMLRRTLAGEETPPVQSSNGCAG